MFHVRNMTAEDFEFGVHITDTMDWQLTKEDFKFMLKLEPHGCFVLLHDSEKIGIVTTVSYGKMSWLGNLIVNEVHRGKGAGALLARQAVNYLTSRNAGTIGLYAYTDRIPFYNRLGFEYESEFIVLRGMGFSSILSGDVNEAKKDDIQDIVSFDKSYFGASRQKLLESILLTRGNSCYIAKRDGLMLGYAIGKAYDDTSELGPLICNPGHSGIAVDLLKANLNRLEGSEISVCLQMKESAIVEMFMKSGFKENFRVARMFFKPQHVKDCIYIAESLERG